jgi:cytosine deaminase
MLTTLLRNARLADGRLVDVECAAGRIRAVAPAGDLPIGGDAAPRYDEIHDLAGMLLLAAPAEPHAHLDKAFTADRVHNATGDLLGAIEAWMGFRATIDSTDIAARAERAALASLANGLTAIRTHVDVGPDIDLRAVEAVLGVRERLADLIDIQVVPLISPPVTGLLGANQRARLRDALAMGADVVGGAPYIDPEPIAALEVLVEAAAQHGVRIDLHTDETLEVHVLTLREYARIVAAHDGAVGAAASHCVSLGMQSEAVQAEVAALVAAAGMSVITLPQTNLFLQSRGITSCTPRGLTAIAPLRAAGVNVAGGADNLQDPFNTVGRADPMETAALLVMAGHLDAADAYELVTTNVRRALGLEPVTIEAGSPAELLAIDATSVREAIASAPGTRRVFHEGRLVASVDQRATFHRAPAARPGDALPAATGNR